MRHGTPSQNDKEPIAEILRTLRQLAQANRNEKLAPWWLRNHLLHVFVSEWVADPRHWAKGVPVPGVINQQVIRYYGEKWPT